MIVDRHPEPVDERLARVLADLAVAARGRGGHATAAAALQAAATLSEDNTSRARRLYAAAADSRLAGQPIPARHLLDAARLHTADAAAYVGLGAEHGRAEMFTGHPALASRILDTEAYAAAAGGDLHRQSYLLTGSAVAALLAGDGGRAAAISAQVRHLRADSSSWLIDTTTLIGGLGGVQSAQRVDTIQLMRASSAVADRRRTGLDEVEYALLAAHAMSLLGEHRKALDVLAAAIEQLRAAGAVGILPFALCVRVYAETRCGQMRLARTVAAEAVELSRIACDEFWQYRALSAQAHVQAILGEEELCRENLARARALQRDDRRYPADAVAALALLELGLGQYRHTLHQPRGDAGDHTDRLGGFRDATMDLLEARLRGRPAPTLASEITEHLADRDDLPLHSAAAWRLRGLIASADQSESCFERALAAHGMADHPFEAARTRLAYGERLRRAGHRVRARQQLRSALESFERIGARRWADRTRGELAATGETLRSRSASFDCTQLTPQEQQVARVVAAGNTNRETATMLFLSAKTVEFHLSNVYRKLGVRTRTELANHLLS